MDVVFHRVKGQVCLLSCTIYDHFSFVQPLHAGGICHITSADDGGILPNCEGWSVSFYIDTYEQNRIDNCLQQCSCQVFPEVDPPPPPPPPRCHSPLNLGKASQRFSHLYCTRSSSSRQSRRVSMQVDATPYIANVDGKIQIDE